jgi:Domain of unknown function (DUF5666)
MKSKLLIASVLIALAGATLLAACGGGGSSGSSSMASANSASGVISGFGSVIVNGHEFATGMNTQVLDGDNDDAASSTANLQVGMTVDVDAMGSSATMLRFTSAVRGEVDAVDSMGMTLTVLGQTVQVTGGTSFAGSNSSNTPIAQLTDIKAGDYVVVYGYLECLGSSCASGGTDIVATLVHEPATPGKYRVEGYVSNFSSMNNNFMINGLTIQIATSGSSPTVCNTMGCAFNNGDFVSVRSTSGPTSTSPLTLTATDIKRRSEGPTFAIGSMVTLEGPITQLGASGFVVRGISVDASNVSLTGLTNNQIVEVTGTVESSGKLMASAITVERHATFLLMGRLDTLQTTMSMTTLTVLGQAFSVTSDTRFGDWAKGMRPFNSGNLAGVLAVGDQLVIAGYPSMGGNVATRIERIPTPSTPTAAVLGVVSADSASMSTLTEVGITVTLNSSTQLFYPGAGATPSLSGFFAAITPNTTLAGALGAPGTTPGTIVAADAAVLRPGVRWED